MLGKRVERNAPVVIRKAALAADQAVVVATPVDTGRARSNWVVSIGSPTSGTREAYVPGAGGATGAANSAAAISQGRTALAPYKNAERSIYITNNLPYIRRLNDGYSAQAPAGFVQTAVKAAVGQIRGVKILPRDLR